MAINPEEIKWEHEDFVGIEDKSKKSKISKKWVDEVEQKLEEQKNEFTGDIMADIESITQLRFGNARDKNVSKVVSILMLSGYFHLDQVKEAVKKYCKVPLTPMGKDIVKSTCKKGFIIA